MAKTVGSGKVECFLDPQQVRVYTGEVEIRNDRVIVTEIININGQPGGAHEINLPLATAIISWQGEVYEEI